jgi:hypothetical protein
MAMMITGSFVSLRSLLPNRARHEACRIIRQRSSLFSNPGFWWKPPLECSEGKFRSVDESHSAECIEALCLRPPGAMRAGGRAKRSYYYRIRIFKLAEGQG